MHKPPALEFKNFGGALLEAATGRALPVKTGSGQAMEYKTVATADAVIETHTENDGEEGIVEAYVAVTGTRDEVGDVIEYGAFDRTLKALRPKMCLGHDWNRPIGEPVEIRVLLPGDPDLPAETADGQPWPAEAGALYTKNRYMLATKDGRDAYEHAKFFKGRTAYSIGYVVKRKRIGLHNGLKTRFIQDLDLYEYGPVLHGAHSLALQKSVKSGEPGDIEHKVRKVKDANYWGYAVGTPITANMRPKGPTARKLRKEGKVPDRQQGTTDAVTAAGKPAPKRTTPDKATADADASGLFPEPQSDARVRARNPKGEHEQHAQDLATVMADDDLTSASMQASFEGLLDEGITPQELDEDLRSQPRPDDIDESDWGGRIDDAVAAYRTSYKRENRRQQTVDKGNAGGGADQLPRNPKANPQRQVDDIMLQTSHGRPEHRDKLIEKAHQRLIDDGVHPDEVDAALESTRTSGKDTPEQHRAKTDAISAEHRRRYDAALAERSGGKGEPGDGGQQGEGDGAPATGDGAPAAGDAGTLGPPPLPEGDDGGTPDAGGDTAPAPRKFDRTEVPGAREGAAYPNPDLAATDVEPPKVRKGSKLHVATSPQTGAKFYRGSPRPYTHATLVTDEKTGAQGAWSFSESQNGALNQAKEFRRRGIRGRIHVVELDANHDGSPDSPELDPNAPGNADAVANSEGMPDVPGVPAEPDPTTTAMWKANPERAATRLPESMMSDLGTLTPGQQDEYQRQRADGRDHGTALDLARTKETPNSQTSEETGLLPGEEAAAQIRRNRPSVELSKLPADELNSQLEQARADGDQEKIRQLRMALDQRESADRDVPKAPGATTSSVPEAAGPEGSAENVADALPEPPAELTPEEQAWANDPAAAADGQLDEEQRTEYDALDDQGKHSYATARIAGENHDDSLAYAQHRSASTAPDAPDAGGAAAPETPPAPGEARPTGAAMTPQNLANALAGQPNRDLSDADTQMLRDTDAEFARRAELLGKPGAVTRSHQNVKDEIARREQAGEGGPAAAGAPGTPSELPASPNLGVQPGTDGATEPAADLEPGAQDASGVAIPGADVTPGAEGVQTPAAPQGDSQAQEATRELAPQRTAQITADDIAEANAAADASFGVEEADDGAFEVDQDVADRQERVGALLDAEAAGSLDLASQTDDGLRGTRADVVNELKLQDHLTARERNAAAPSRSQRSGTDASGGDGSGDSNAEPAVDPGPKVRPGIAGALEDFADALDGDDPDEVLRARARLLSSLKRSRTDSEVVTAVRAVIESTDMPDPALLRAAAERLRAEARERRNSQARARRAARRFERDRLRSLLGSVDAEMRRRNLAYDPVPGLDGDVDTTAPAAGGPAPGTWTDKPGILGSGTVSSVEGANYSGRVDTFAGSTQPRYSWSVTADDGTELASGSGVLDDPDVARTAIAHALATQQTLGRIPADAVLPQPGGTDNAASRREIERSGVDAITARLDDSSVNPVTGLPNPLAPPTGLDTPPVKVFDSPQAVRAYLDANTVHHTGTPNAAGPVRWDDVKLSPGGGLAVGTLDDGTPTLFHAASGRSIPPMSNGRTVPMNRSDLMKLATFLESLTDAEGKRVDWGEPDSKVVGNAALHGWKSPADGSSLIEAATRAVIMDKIRDGKWTDQAVRRASLKPIAGDGTNPSRRALIDDLRSSYGQLINVRRGPVPAEDKKTMALIHGAGQLSDAGAPDAAAVVLRRRAAEVRQLAEDARKAADSTPGNRNLADKAQALETSALHTGVLESLADAHLSMHSPTASPGTRILRAQPGERLAFLDGSDGVRTYRFLTPMRASGSERQGESSSYAQVVDETTGEQLTAAVISGAGMRPQVQVFDPDKKIGVFTGADHTTQLGGNGFVVLDENQAVPEADGFRDAALADIASVPTAALDRAAEELPETGAERAARRAAAPEGGRAPARRSAAAPRRQAPEARSAPSTDEQKLAQAQTDRMGSWLGSPFEANDAAAPGGFASLDEVAKAADLRAASLPADTDRQLRSSMEALTSGAYGGTNNPNLSSGGAKLAPGGHLIVRKDGSIVHARSGAIIWSPNGSWLPGKYAFETPSPAQTMRIADYLERVNIGGETIPWESPDTEKLRTAFQSIADKTGINPVTTATRAAVADHMAGVSRPTGNDVKNLDTLAFAVDVPASMPNPDVFNANLRRGAQENAYTVLGGGRVPHSQFGVTSGTDNLPGPADSKEGQTLAKRIAGEYALTRAQAKVAPLDAARRLDALAIELDGRAITSRDGKTFTPSSDLRARAQAVRDAYDPDKPSPLGQLGRANYDATIKPDWSKADITVGRSINGRDAESGTRNVRTARLKAELREGGTVRMDRSEAGRLRVMLAGRTVEDGVDGGLVRINGDGSVETAWQEDLFGGAARPVVMLPGGSWQLDNQVSTGPGELTDEEYQAHTADIEAKLAAAFSDGQATDVVHTIGHDGQSWTPERAKLHNEIIDEMWQANGAAVPTEGRAVLAGGLGGAGKSTVLKGYAGVDATQYFTINSDDVKEAMAARDMIPAVEGLSPMESVALVHEESGYIANLLAARAYANNTNVVWDMTMGNRATAEQRVKELRDAGYTDIGGVFVDIPVETSVERALARHRRGMEKQAAGDGYGGRYVPPSVIRANTSETASSRNRENFDALRDGFTSWVMYDNSVAGREPQKVAGTGTWA